MALSVRDPLLMIAKGIIWFFIGVFTLATGAVLVAAPVVLVMQDRLMAEIVKQGGPPDAGIVGAILIVLVGVAALLALMVWFLLNLRKIVDSVEDGDPFAPANAARLARMGWIALGGQLAAIPVGAMAMYIDTVLGDAGDKLHVRSDFSFDAGGILLVIVLFILARVFRHGAAMREDLEGTV